MLTRTRRGGFGKLESVPVEPVMTMPVITASSLQLRTCLHLQGRTRQRTSDQPNRKL